LCSCIGRLVPFVSESFCRRELSTVEGDGYLLGALNELVSDRDVEVGNAAVVALSSILNMHDMFLNNLSVEAKESFELFSNSSFDAPQPLFDRFAPIENISLLGSLFSSSTMPFDVWISLSCVSLLQLFENGGSIFNGISRICECMFGLF
jgi:hypothetical protein